MFEHKEELAQLMTLEMGKPISETRGEVHYAASFIEWCAEEAGRIAGERINLRFPHKRGLTISEPVGIVYAVTPWNFPAGMITRKAAPALAAGCVMILKPAELSPMTALYLTELWLKAGGPANTFQVLPTNDASALTQPFMNDSRVRKLTFTGSTEVGRLLCQSKNHCGRGRLGPQRLASRLKRRQQPLRGLWVGHPAQRQTLQGSPHRVACLAGRKDSPDLTVASLNQRLSSVSAQRHPTKWQQRFGLTHPGAASCHQQDGSQ